MKPVIFGCSGLALTGPERDFFTRVDPFGFILFQRNCETPEQVAQLTQQLRGCVGRPDAPVFIDQEGGRVARLKPPHWPALSALRPIGALYEQDPQAGIAAMAAHARQTAEMLYGLGINGNCSPVLDLYIEGASSAIGDRAISRDPAVVAALGAVIIENFLAQGVLPVIKHLPGHGRVRVDPHLAMPTVDADAATLAAEDFRPFIALKDAPIGMNCHVLFTALDPEQPVSLSAKIHRDIIRGAIGFEGLLFSDDLAMKALAAPLPQRARSALAAGADILLYCTGALAEMADIARDLPPISDAARERWEAAKNRLRVPATANASA